MTREEVSRLAADCVLASECLKETGTFETGQGILREAACALLSTMAKLDKAEAERDRLAAANAQLEARVVELAEAGVRALALLCADGRGDTDIVMSLVDALAAHGKEPT